MKHLLEYTSWASRDPDARLEAIAYCGHTEECSGSGKHSMVYFKASSDCPKCVEAEREEALHEAKSAPHKAHYVPASNVYPYDHKSKVL